MPGDRFWGPCQEGTHLLHVGVEFLGVPDVLLLGLAQAVVDGVENLLIEQGQLWGDMTPQVGTASRDVLHAAPRISRISSSQLPKLRARPCHPLHPALPAHHWLSLGSISGS